MGPIGTLQDLFAALWRKAWLLALALGIGIPLVLAYAMAQPRVYEARAIIQMSAGQGARRA